MPYGMAVVEPRILADVRGGAAGGHNQPNIAISLEIYECLFTEIKNHSRVNWHFWVPVLQITVRYQL